MLSAYGCCLVLLAVTAFFSCHALQNGTRFITSDNETFAEDTLFCLDDEDCEIYCLHVLGCYKTIINCPLNANCYIKCDSQNSVYSGDTYGYACFNTTIYAQDSLTLRIDVANDAYNFHNSIVYAPTSKYTNNNNSEPSTFIDCGFYTGRQPKQPVCGYGCHFFAYGGWSDIQLRYVHGNDDAIECYSDQQMMSCDTSYNITCDKWRYDYEGHIICAADLTCNDFHNPTSAPTRMPSSQSLAPTAFPTINFTYSPTSLSPSMLPSQIPTKYPTVPPTKAPITDSPSRYPTTSPVSTGAVVTNDEDIFGLSVMTFIYIVISAVGACLICLAIGICIYCRHSASTEDKAMKMQMTQMGPTNMGTVLGLNTANPTSIAENNNTAVNAQNPIMNPSSLPPNPLVTNPAQTEAVGMNNDFLQQQMSAMEQMQQMQMIQHQQQLWQQMQMQMGNQQYMQQMSQNPNYVQYGGMPAIWGDTGVQGEGGGEKNQQKMGMQEQMGGQQMQMGGGQGMGMQGMNQQQMGMQGMNAQQMGGGQGMGMGMQGQQPMGMQGMNQQQMGGGQGMGMGMQGQQPMGMQGMNQQQMGGMQQPMGMNAQMGGQQNQLSPEILAQMQNMQNMQANMGMGMNNNMNMNQGFQGPGSH